jgi:[ribosomal protein S18]-alanine N-acetyltransferase
MLNANDQVVFRSAAPIDLPLIHELEHTHGYARWFENDFAKELSNPLSHTELALTNERPIAFLITWEIVFELHIQNIVVHTTFRRCGIAQDLIERALHVARQKRLVSVHLELRHNNKAAFRLYQKLGFHTDGVRHQYYTDTLEDALLMNLEL